MGCCFSRPEGPNSPYPGGAPPSASARAINIPGPAGASSAAVTASSVAASTAAAVSGGGGASAPSPVLGRRPLHHRQHAQHASSAAAAAGSAGSAGSTALAQHINKPLRRRRWSSRSRVWTRRAIDRERDDFFDTRVTDRPEIWQTLHAALAVLWEADRARQAHDNEDESRDANEQAEAEALATAQSMLDAAGITLPTGNLAQGAYDVFGSLYALPAWIVSDPENLAEDSGEHSRRSSRSGDDSGTGTDAAAHSDFEPNSDSDDADHGPGHRRHSRREEKGKAVAASAGPLISVRARLSATSRDVVVPLGEDETVRSLVHRIAEAAQLPRKTRIRIAYLGKILKDNASLPAQGWQEGHVVNALVFEPV